MALTVENYNMRHSVIVSTMPKMLKNQSHVSDEVVVSAISSAKPIYAAGGLPSAVNNLQADTLATDKSNVTLEVHHGEMECSKEVPLG